MREGTVTAVNLSARIAPVNYVHGENTREFAGNRARGRMGRRGDADALSRCGTARSRWKSARSNL